MPDDDETLEDIADQTSYHVKNPDKRVIKANMKPALAKSKLRRALLRAKHVTRRVTLATKA